MTYEEMINEVCAGKTAFRAIDPDTIVFREGDTIIRRSHRKVEINQIFIASVAEQKATDWDIVAEEDHHDGLDYLRSHGILHFEPIGNYGVIQFHHNNLRF